MNHSPLPLRPIRHRHRQAAHKGHTHYGASTPDKLSLQFPVGDTKCSVPPADLPRLHDPRRQTNEVNKSARSDEVG